MGRVTHLSGAQLQGSQRQPVSPQAPPRTARTDLVQFSADGMALNRLVRTWGAISGLFGLTAANKGPDLSGLREALAQARKNVEAVQLRERVADTLKGSALRQAEALVEKYYGLKGDGTTVKVRFDNNIDGALASVSFRYDQRGRIVDPNLHINMSQFTPDSGPNGVNSHIIQNDRIIAHEMVHLVMGRNMDLASLPDWFSEGTAEYIAGGAERVSLSLRRMSPDRLLSKLLKPWDGDTDSYAAGYLAVRYLDSVTAGNGGLRAVMGRLKEGDTLDSAIAAVSQGRFQSTAQFVRDFATGGEGVQFLRTLDLSGRDPGSIKPVQARDIVADTGIRSEQPLRGFRLQWPSPLEGLPSLLPSFGFAGDATPSVAALAYRRQMGSGLTGP